MKLTKRTIWITVALLLLILAGVAYVQTQRSRQLSGRPEIDFSDPNIIAIAEGTEGEIHSLEIGVGYVGADRANLAIFDNEQAEVGMLDTNITPGSSITVNAYFIIVLDIDAAQRNVVLEVLPQSP